MATILPLKVAKRQPFEKVSLERCLKRELLSLIGKLNWAFRVTPANAAAGMQSVWNPQEGRCTYLT